MPYASTGVIRAERSGLRAIPSRRWCTARGGERIVMNSGEFRESCWVRVAEMRQRATAATSSQACCRVPSCLVLPHGFRHDGAGGCGVRYSVANLVRHEST